MSALAGCHGRLSEVQAAVQCKASPLGGHTWLSLAPALHWGRHSGRTLLGAAPQEVWAAHTVLCCALEARLDGAASLPAMRGWTILQTGWSTLWLLTVPG